MPNLAAFADVLRDLSPETPVLIAGPTASGKSALALEIAQAQGGVIVNADASQIYDCWRVITARPSAEEEAQAAHALYGHVAAHQEYSAGHWLREVLPLLEHGQRPIITGGTGLYFSTLTKGLADIPATPAEVRMQGNDMATAEMLDLLDSQTLARTDTLNRARVQRAWEVQHSTGRGLAAWQDDTGPPPLPVGACHPIVFDVDKDWLNARIEQRFDLMLAAGALEEVTAQLPQYDPSLSAHRAIGVPELVGYLKDETSLEDARDAAIIATRRFAKRQRTWMRNKMGDWHKVTPG